jgi:hypothetical protein
MNPVLHIASEGQAFHPCLKLGSILQYSNERPAGQSSQLLMIKWFTMKDDHTYT